MVNNMSENLYEKLRNEYRFYCLGKSERSLKGACRYLEGLIDRTKYKIMREIVQEFNVCDGTLGQRSKEIAHLLNLDILSGGLNFELAYCDFCGRKFKFKLRHNKDPHMERICYTCKRSFLRYIWKKWEKANVCIICGELNPLFLIEHHILGRDKAPDTTIFICANCHELTKPRSRQSFFLFNNWKFPETKFSIDNSKIYIDL
jgi:hypothetical protein